MSADDIALALLIGDVLLQVAGVDPGILADLMDHIGQILPQLVQELFAVVANGIRVLVQVLLVGEVVALALVGMQVDAVHILIDVDRDVVPIDLVLGADGFDAEGPDIVHSLRLQPAQCLLDIVHGI